MNIFNETLHPQSKESRIKFARKSVSRAKCDLKRLAKHDEAVLELVFQLEFVQRELAKRYKKGTIL